MDIFVEECTGKPCLGSAVTEHISIHEVQLLVDLKADGLGRAYHIPNCYLARWGGVRLSYSFLTNLTPS